TKAGGNTREAGFRFAYDTPAIRFGTGSIAQLSRELERLGIDRVLVVCGRSVGSNETVMEGIEAGLGDRLAGVFDRTTPQKRFATAIEGADALQDAGADGLIGLGGGSSLDLTKAVSVVAAADRPPAALGAEFEDTGTLQIPAGSLPPIVAVPTTLAGADLSNVAGLNASPESGPVESDVSGGLSDRRLMPRGVLYDPDLFASTPRPVLAASAMNGFDKGIETLYAKNATPITDATAVRGLTRLADSLPGLGTDSVTAQKLEPVVEGIVLVQFGISRPGETTLSIIHAFGHGLTDGYGVQQGAAHAVIAPHALRYLFDRVDGRRDLLAAALGVGEASDPAAAVVDRVTALRDALGLPARLRDVEGPDPAAFRDVARVTLEDAFMDNAPPGLDPSIDDLVDILEEAY
ncbi:MAG: iron-containing alcohol dehydrogenase family protein, partial [Halodesulfurarchaeum sp.]